MTRADANAVRLVLLGLRGAGKSTLGAAAARALATDFVDLDDRTARALGASRVRDAWDAHGERAFRAAEVETLRAVLDEGVGIIALGGGTPTAPGAEHLLRPLKRPMPPRLIYLRAPADVLAARMRASGLADRPSLTGAPPMEEVAAVLAQRDPLYRALADAVIEVGALTPEQALRELLRKTQAASRE